MISDTRVDRYYYIFDSCEHRALVLDRATGEEQRAEADPRTSLIGHVRTKRSPALQRRFAQWCARQVDPGAAPSHTAAGRLWAAAQRDDPAAWKRVRRETSDSVMLDQRQRDARRGSRPSAGTARGGPTSNASGLHSCRRRAGRARRRPHERAVGRVLCRVQSGSRRTGHAH